jgi:short-subunit dehydrogenase
MSVAVVTGAGRGIGRAITCELARSGGVVGLVARTGRELDETASLISEAGGRAMAATADVTVAAEVEGASRRWSASSAPSTSS